MKDPKQAVNYENNDIAEQNVNADEESNPTEPVPEQNEVHENDAHELQAANQSDRI